MHEIDLGKLPVETIKHDSKECIDSDKLSISSIDRLQEILKETEDELLSIQPEIDSLTDALTRLQELKQTKQKLITLKLSVKSILNNFSNVTLEEVQDKSLVSVTSEKFSNKTFSTKLASSKTKPFLSPPKPVSSLMPQERYPGTFYPNRAFEAADEVLSQKSSINYELFRAVVYAGGRASTQEIKQYLLDHDVRLPVSGDTFDEVPLTDISSRINYLIRKELVAPDGRGYFRATVGWEYLF